MVNEKNTGGYYNDLVHTNFCTGLDGKLAEKLPQSFLQIAVFNAIIILVTFTGVRFSLSHSLQPAFLSQSLPLLHLQVYGFSAIAFHQ